MISLSIYNRTIAFLILFLFSPSSLAHNFLDVTKHGYEQYQHIVINGKIVENMPPTHGQQPEKRYEVIKKTLDLYERPFTMLDLGAAQGYHSLKAAWQYPQSVFVMIEGNNSVYRMAGDQLLSICKANDRLHNIIHLNKSLYIDDLAQMGKCEHFDVVLALNVIHWLGNDWKNAIKALLTLGDNIIIETPPAQQSAKTKDIITYLYSIGAELIAEVPRHTDAKNKAPMFLLKSTKSQTLTQSTWFSRKGPYEIISDFKHKKLKKKDKGIDLTTDWLPGINFITFKMYQGEYPSVQTLKNEIESLKNVPHNDWAPNNIIVQGNKLALIDHNSSFFAQAASKPTTYQRLFYMLKFVDAKKPDDIKKIFNSIIGSTRSRFEEDDNSI